MHAVVKYRLQLRLTKKAFRLPYLPCRCALLKKWCLPFHAQCGFSYMYYVTVVLCAMLWSVPKQQAVQPWSSQ
ncbi:Uncharacterised protein [Mycobacteroides abscessus subsp. abscessus]|nr:Uncharacterised protein [Mycobacteroides abscessus subsp. abscessus]